MCEELTEVPEENAVVVGLLKIRQVKEATVRFYARGGFADTSLMKNQP